MPLIRSWIESANDPDGDFPVNNLPFGVFSTEDPEDARVGVAIGASILDLAALEEAGLIPTGPDGPVFDLPYLNEFLELGPTAWAGLRDRLTALLSEGGDPALRDDAALRAAALVPLAGATLHLPVVVQGFTDFYAGRQHAFNVGTMFRGAENALPPNWLHMPIGYNGRASSVVVSGTDIHRPLGQRKPADADRPVFGPSTRLDFELEMGAIVGAGSEMGRPVTTAEADGMIFGYVLLNDWSARDIQAWEYQPLGPFQGKAFATSISPWVVTAAALEPFRTPSPDREKPLLPYLTENKPGLYDITLEVTLTPDGAEQPTLLTRTNYRRLYYSAAQQLAHHASSGCPMQPGDLLGSGTISGPTRAEYGSLLELAWGGKDPFPLVTGGSRSFLEDGDTVTFRGHAAGDGYRIGFGQVTGRILPSPPEPDWTR